MAISTRQATQAFTRMWRHLGLIALAVMLALGIGLSADAAPAPTENCTTMLKSTFDWAGPRPQSQGSYQQAYATITDHTTKDVGNLDTARDQVFYGSSNLYKTTVNGQTVLQGNVLLYTNQYESGTNPFQRFGEGSYVVTVQPNGIVSLQPQLAGKNFLGRGPTVFQGTCTGGLIVANETQTTLFIPGSHALSISFHNNTYYYIA